MIINVRYQCQLLNLTNTEVYPLLSHCTIPGGVHSCPTTDTNRVRLTVLLAARPGTMVSRRSVLADLLVAVDLLLLVAPLVVEDLLLLPVGYGIGPPPPVPAVAGPAPRPVLMADPDPLTRRDLTRDSQAVIA